MRESEALVLIRCIMGMVVLTGCAPPEVTDLGVGALSIELILPVHDEPNPTIPLQPDGTVSTAIVVDVDGTDFIFSDPSDELKETEDTLVGHWHLRISDGRQIRSFEQSFQYDSAEMEDLWQEGDLFIVKIELVDSDHQTLESGGVEIATTVEFSIAPAVDPQDTD
jgi:hypothetical protein